MFQSRIFFALNTINFYYTILSKHMSSTSLSTSSNTNDTKLAMLRVIIELGKADFKQDFRHPLPPFLENYSSFVEASLDLSTLFSKVLLSDNNNNNNSYTPLAFEDDIVAMLLNCVCYHSQSSDYGALAIRLLTNNLREIFDRSGLPATRRWLSSKPKPPTRARGDDDALRVEGEENENSILVIKNTALRAVCLDAFHYLAGCEGFKSLVGNDKITSSPHSIIGHIYNNHHHNQHNGMSVLPARSVVELYQRLKSITPAGGNRDGNTRSNKNDYFDEQPYQNVDQVARDVHLLIQSVIAARTPSTCSPSELNALLQLRMTHCHRAFKVALDNVKKRALITASTDNGHHHFPLPDSVLDALTLHNCPIQRGLVERQISPSTEQLIESKLSPTSSAADVLNMMKIIVAVLIEKDGSISLGNGAVSFPLFDDNLLNFVSSSSKGGVMSDVTAAAAAVVAIPHSLYFLQCQLISGRFPQTMMDLLSSSSSNQKFERKDLIWRTIKGEVEKIITEIVSRYGVEHHFSTVAETFRKQLHTFVSEHLR